MSTSAVASSCFASETGTLFTIPCEGIFNIHPKVRRTALVAVDSFEHVTRLLSFVERELAAQLSAFEVMWREFYEITTSGGVPPVPRDWPFYVLIEALGARRMEDSDRFEGVLAAALQ